jgi:hypothetical protein
VCFCPSNSNWKASEYLKHILILAIPLSFISNLKRTRSGIKADLSMARTSCCDEF